jgi:hypothetical protein
MRSSHRRGLVTDEVESPTRSSHQRGLVTDEVESPTRSSHRRGRVTDAAQHTRLIDRKIRILCDTYMSTSSCVCGKKRPPIVSVRACERDFEPSPRRKPRSLGSSSCSTRSEHSHEHAYRWWHELDARTLAIGCPSREVLFISCTSTHRTCVLLSVSLQAYYSDMYD